MASKTPAEAEARDTTLGRRLREARDGKGFSQSELARRAGLSGPARISDWETDRVVPELESVVRLLRALKPVSCAYLLLGEGPLWTIDEEQVKQIAEWVDQMPPSLRPAARR
jgi:transcriptional regulator with XRE-family HTH domain